MLPNYGTVRTNKTLPPPTVGQKFRIATASAFDWAVWPFNGALAAIAQANNTIGTYMTTAIFPSLLHEARGITVWQKGRFLTGFTTR